MAKSAAERQREYRARLKAEGGRPDTPEETEFFRRDVSGLRQLREDVDSLSELFERFDSLEARVAKLEDLAERRR